ncbi:MAG: sensor hybrid histidine kinase [Thermoleophilia bacterium]|nr:sensor hybrid histidine kinase [Thermoleophilia bacterium]
MNPLEKLISLPSADGMPLAAVALEHLPVSASIVSAIRGEDGVVTDFCIEYSNLAASATSPDRTEAYGLALFDVIPAFREVGLFDRYVEVLDTGRAYTEEGVRLTGTYGDLEYDVRVDVVAIRLDANHILSVSHDRTEQHQASVRLVNVQEALSRREQMDRHINAVNAGLIEDLVDVQRALDRNDVGEARRHASRGAQRASEVVMGLRDVIRTGG